MRALERVADLARAFESTVVVASVAPVYDFAEATPVTGLGHTAETLVELGESRNAD